AVRGDAGPDRAKRPGCGGGGCPGYRARRDRPLGGAAGVGRLRPPPRARGAGPGRGRGFRAGSRAAGAGGGLRLGRASGGAERGRADGGGGLARRHRRGLRYRARHAVGRLAAGAGRAGAGGGRPWQRAGRGRAAQAPAAPDPRLVAAAADSALAFVITGDPQLDRASELGLAGLSAALRARTTVEPGTPVAVDLDQDDLSLLTFLYWPVTAEQPPPSP